MKTPKVSILMPVYNGEKYLRLAIDSILKQSFTDFEFIIVNDGSNDQTKAIIDSYNDDRIVLIDQKNQGVARSLNNGLKIARGEYVRRHDADDISLAGSLDEQVGFLDDHPEYALLSNQIAFMSDRAKIAHNFRNPHNSFFNQKSFIEVDYDMYKKHQPIIHATVLMRSKVLKELGGYRIDFLTSEDVDLWLRFLDNHKAVVLNTCNYFVRLHATSATKVHHSSVDFYRELAYQYAEDRKKLGTDPLMRGELIAKPKANDDIFEDVQKPTHGNTFREDLGFYYNLLWDAKDFVNLKEIATAIISDGWKDIRSWKLLLFPILGSKLINTGVKTKRIFRNYIGG